MDMVKEKRNPSASSHEFKALWQDLDEEQKRMRILREQRETVRLQKERELWHSASEFAKVSPVAQRVIRKKENHPSASNFFAKLRLERFLG